MFLCANQNHYTTTFCIIVCWRVEAFWANVGSNMPVLESKTCVEASIVSEIQMSRSFDSC